MIPALLVLAVLAYLVSGVVAHVQEARAAMTLRRRMESNGQDFDEWLRSDS